jgi:uncharacterized membrane protein YhaH (DUF805 family)
VFFFILFLFAFSVRLQVKRLGDLGRVGKELEKN